METVDNAPSNTPTLSPERANSTYNALAASTVMPLRLTAMVLTSRGSADNEEEQHHQQVQERKHLSINDLIDAAAATEWSSGSNNYTHTDFDGMFDSSKAHTSMDTTMTPFDMEIYKHCYDEGATSGGRGDVLTKDEERRIFLRSTPPMIEDSSEFHMEFPEPRIDFFLEEMVNNSPFQPSDPPNDRADAVNSDLNSFEHHSLPPLSSLNVFGLERGTQRDHQATIRRQAGLVDLPLMNSSPTPPNPFKTLTPILPPSPHSSRRLRKGKMVDYSRNCKETTAFSPECSNAPAKNYRADKQQLPHNFYQRNPSAIKTQARHRQFKTTILARSKNGCWTCRIRKKKCSEEKPSCAQCVKLGLTCDGYSVEKPVFMDNQKSQREKLDAIKKKTALKKKIGIKKVKL
ncbi:unnamed protein product [Cyberlindnera jadinii]|uniref:Zn(2)-C6 fungal-type domain-containing protein n=1 Tax=Cyberlindnera jadinii (strain ATCC 18201 / CBS 1600 / BCRC 20928 / JCM 3617 / NBRC 0987 / NRRL Y-1542) TaxID=983966 RepID=A0A0H5C4X9_CYBJN|nr:unnamed protein product [Cyberlindnera jadinii]